MADWYASLGANANLHLQIYETGTDTPGNYSAVQINVWIERTAGTGRHSSYTNNNWNDSLSNGFATSGSGTYDLTGGSQLLMRNNSNVGHNSDGTGSVSGYAYFNDPHNNIGTNSVSGGIGLSTIPRASTPTFSPNPANAGTTITINTNRASSGFTHNIYYSIGSIGNTLIASGVTDSTTFAIPLSLLNQIPNSASGAVNIYTETYSGGTLIGTSNTSFTMTVPVTAVPDFTTITTAEAVSAVGTAVGAYVQGLSKLTLAITGAAGIYGSTIVSYQVTVAGQTVINSSPSVGTTPSAIASSGTLTVTGTITDSRGRTKTKTITVTVLAYAAPVITAITGQRAIAAGTVNDNGTYIRANINASVSSLLNGATQKNDLTYKIWVRDHNVGGAFTLKTTVDTHGISFNSYGLVGTYAVTNSWDVLVEVSDIFATSSVQFIITTASIFQHWNSSLGVGIGKYREHGMLDVLGEIYKNNGYRVLDVNDLTLAVGVIDPYWTSGNPKVTFPDTTTASVVMRVRGGTVQPGDTILCKKIGATWYGEEVIALAANSMAAGYTNYFPLPGATTYFRPWDIKTWGNKSPGFRDYDPTVPYWVTRNTSGVVTIQGFSAVYSALSANQVFATLPVGFRPSTQRTFPVMINDDRANLTIGTDGTMSFGQAVTTSSWVSLVNVIFHDVAQDLTWVPIASFLNGFSQKSGTTPVAVAIDSFGWVWLRGAINYGTTLTDNTPMFNFPSSAYYPSHQRHFPAATDGNTYLGIRGTIEGGTAANSVNFKNPSGLTGSWVSLDGVVFQPAAQDNMLNYGFGANELGTYGAIPWYNSWNNYASTPFSPASFGRRSDGLVLGQGLVSAGTVNANLGPIPVGLRPLFRSAFERMSNNVHGRFTIDPWRMDDSTGYQSPGLAIVEVGSNIWFSIDGVCYQAAQ